MYDIKGLYYKIWHKKNKYLIVKIVKRNRLTSKAIFTGIVKPGEAETADGCKWHVQGHYKVITSDEINGRGGGVSLFSLIPSVD